jgi:hypothetical protein
VDLDADADRRGAGLGVAGAEALRVQPHVAARRLVGHHEAFDALGREALEAHAYFL